MTACATKPLACAPVSLRRNVAGASVALTLTFGFTLALSVRPSFLSYPDRLRVANEALTARVLFLIRRSRERKQKVHRSPERERRHHHRSSSASPRRRRSPSSESSNNSSSSEADERKRRRSKARKRSRSHEKKKKKKKKSDHRKGKKPKKLKKKRSKRDDASSSSSSDSSSDSDAPRSAISGKKIKRKLDRSAADVQDQKNRQQLLQFYNGMFD